jgi:hypothetical protein
MKIPAGTIGYIGAPAKPIRKEISDAIGSELGQIPEILEVHLPQVYIKGLIDPPSPNPVCGSRGEHTESARKNCGSDETGAATELLHGYYRIAP